MSKHTLFTRKVKLKIFVGLFFIVGLCGAFFFIRSSTFLDWVEGRLETELKNRIDATYTANVGKIEGNILGSVSIRSVEISKENKPVISTGKVVLKYNLLGLLTRKFEVKELQVDKPEIHARRNPEGALNLSDILGDQTTQASPQSQDSPQFGFAVKYIKCENGTIDYIDTQRSWDLRIDGITIEVKGPLNTWQHEGTFEIKRGSFTVNGAETAIDKFNADFHILASGSTLDELRLEFGSSTLEVTGEFTYGETDPPWNSKVDLDLNLADIDPFFGEDIELEGDVDATLAVEGTGSALAGTLSVEIPTFSAVTAKKDIPKITLTAGHIDADFNAEPIPIFTLKQLSFQVADGTVVGDGSITSENALEGDLLKQFQQLLTHPMTYRGKWDATEIQLIPLLSMFVQLPENLADSTGRLSSSGEFSGNHTDPSSLELASKILLTETILDEVKLNDSTLKCTIGAGELKIDGNLDETGINVTGPFPVGRQDILEIQVSGIDVDDLMKIANSADIGGIGALSAQLSDGTLKGFMEIPNATFNDIPIGTLSGDFRYQEGRVFIENGLMTKNTIEGTSGVQTPPTKEFLSRTTITGTVEVEGEFPADISVVADPVYVQHYPKLLLGAEYPVEGEIRGELKLDGTLVNLDGTADFSVTEGVAWGIHLDPLVLPLEVEDYNLTIPDFKITTRGQQVTLNVAVASNADYDLLLENNSPVHLEEIAKAANLPDFPFEGQFDVRVVGKLKKPEDADFQVELDFSGVTFLHTERGTKYPLGDVYLLGKLVESSYQSSVNKGQLTEGLVKSDSASTENPNLPLDADTKQQSTSAVSELITDAYFDFHGHGFEKTSRIQGYVSLALGNPYRFTAEGEKFDITPILPILHPTLEAVTGTADGNASISGTIADLVAPTANIASESQRQKIYPYDVDILVRTSQLRYETTVTRRIAFTNAEPIRLNLKDDTWTIETLSLRASENKVPFLELIGTLDSKNEMMNLHAVSDGFALPPFSEVLGLPRGMLQTGTLRYDLKVTGTPTQPNLQLEWATPTLTLETEAGDIDITDAGGAITYQEETLRFEECAFTIFGNDGHLEGYVDVQPEAVDSSELHLRVDTIALDLTTLPVEAINNFGSGNGITGILEASIEIGGTLAEPLVLLYAETAGQHPIRFVSYIPSITLERLRVDIHLDSEFVRIQKMEANGQMGEGPYRIQGEAVFSRQDREAMRFDINVSASQVEIGDYGFASGYAKLSGTGLDLQQITVIGEINELELDGYDFRLINRAPLRFRSDPRRTTEDTEPLVVEIPLQLTSPTMTAAMAVNVAGTFTSPEIAIDWQGTLNQKEWTGKIQYQDERINVTGIELKNSEGVLTLAGVIPFNLAFEAMDISERFIAAPIDVRLRGSELPLSFFPEIDTAFSEMDGTVDIDLGIQGTSQSPYVVGNVFVEALQLRLKDLHGFPLQNMQIHLSARKDWIDFTEFRFDIGAGYCRLERGRIALKGLMPEDLILQGLRLERFPLGSTLPPNLLEEVEGHITTTLKTLRIPFDNFLASGESTPFPQIREIPSLADLVAVANADLLIDSVRLAFKAMDRHYDFQASEPTPIVLSDGTFVLMKDFVLENRDEFSIKQTFTAEDRKPDGVRAGNVIQATDSVYSQTESPSPYEQTLSAKTTLSIDAESKWAVDGAFDGALRIKNFDVSVITDRWPVPYRVTGALSGSLQMSGTSENPKITVRRHESEPAELYLHDIPIDLRWRIRYQNGKWEITEKRYVEVTFGENQLTFSWTMPYKFEVIPFLTALQQTPEKVWTELQQTEMRGTLDIKVNDLTMLPSVVPGLSTATGTSEIHTKLTGTIETPQVDGSVRFENIGLAFPEANIRVKEAEGDIRLSEIGATIRQFEGILNEGRFVTGGSIIAPPDRRIWEKLPTLNLSTGLTSTVFEQAGQYRVDLASMSFRLHGELLHPRLTGELDINGGYYQQNWESVRDWLTGSSVKETELVLDYPILRDLHLDGVDINISDNFRVLSSITGPTDIEIACLGKLFGTIRQPVYSGNVSVLSGKIGFIAQTFEFLEGSRISNQSTVDFDPELNIFLRTPNRIRGVLPRDGSTIDLQVYAAFTGTLSNPNFVLSAPPETTTEALSHDDIIDFILQNAALSGAFGAFTFSFHRPLDEDARYISAEYPLGKNVSIKIETNEKREHGIDIEFKGRF
ncbi:MAG: translocation/assembly module TamB domain-containing protein [Candidatus Poribacteria bacterium]|nr:translocation/assembly module TamB domain-containing protein [Candidatus Poribacteria bacterium]